MSAEAALASAHPPPEAAGDPRGDQNEKGSARVAGAIVALELLLPSRWRERHQSRADAAFREDMMSFPVEVFRVVFLNSKNQMISFEDISVSAKRSKKSVP